MLDVSNKNKVIEAMQQNDCDFSLVSIVPEEMNVEKLELMDNRLYLAGNSDNTTRVKYPSDLRKLTLLFREEGSATRKAMIEYLKKNDISPAKSMTLVSNEAIKQAINAGLGYSIVPLIGLRTALKSEKIKLYPIKGLPITTKWNLIYNRNKQLTPAQKELINFINLHKEEVMKEHFDWALQPD
jgi:DNA-binding transcriptional LysR family regulator